MYLVGDCYGIRRRSGQTVLEETKDRARRNQNKYYNFHKDIGHEMTDYIQLRDQIELLR